MNRSPLNTDNKHKLWRAAGVSSDAGKQHLLLLPATKTQVTVLSRQAVGQSIRACARAYDSKPQQFSHFQ